MFKVMIFVTLLLAAPAFADPPCLALLHRAKDGVRGTSRAWLTYMYTQQASFRDFLGRVAGVTDSSPYRTRMTNQVLEILSLWTAKDDGSGRMINLINLITLPERRHCTESVLLEAERMVQRWREKLEHHAFLPFESFFDEADVSSDLNHLNELLREPGYFQI